MSFQQGLSGLNAASKNLDVIGHNIANSNTVGFKASRAEFAEMVASAIGSSGGTNAGIGVEVGAVSQQFTQGNLTITGNSLDVAINGNGFFTLTLPDGTPAYTRSGNFKLDKEGNMITNDNANVMGYPAEPPPGWSPRNRSPPCCPIKTERSWRSMTSFIKSSITARGCSLAICNSLDSIKAGWYQDSRFKPRCSFAKAFMRG